MKQRGFFIGPMEDVSCQWGPWNFPETRMEVPGCQLPETEFFETLKDQLSLWLYVLRDAGIGVVHGNCRRPRSFYWVHGSCQFPESLYPAGHQAIGFPFIRKDRLSSDRGCRGSWLTWRWRCTIRETARIFYWAHGRCRLPVGPMEVPSSERFHQGPGYNLASFEALFI